MSSNKDFLPSSSPIPSICAIEIEAILFLFMMNCYKSSFQECITIDHFHYDVTRAKVSGSCSKDRIAPIVARSRESVKNQQKRHVGQGKLPGVLQSYVLDCYTNSKKFSVELFFFDKRGIAKSVVNEHFNGKIFFQILNTECVAGKRVLTMCQ